MTRKLKRVKVGSKNRTSANFVCSIDAQLPALDRSYELCGGENSFHTTVARSRSAGDEVQEAGSPAGSSKLPSDFSPFVVSTWKNLDNASMKKEIRSESGKSFSEFLLPTNMPEAPGATVTECGNRVCRTHYCTKSTVVLCHVSQQQHVSDAELAAALGVNSDLRHCRSQWEWLLRELPIQGKKVEKLFHILT